MKIAIATENPAKVQATRDAFRDVFPNETIDVISVPASSALPEQPLEDDIMKGAEARAHGCIDSSDADLGVGIEAGLLRVPGSDRWVSTQVCVLCDRNGRISVGLGPGYELPAAIQEAVQRGEPLKEAFERILDVADTERRGAVFHLSDGVMDRIELTRTAVRMALLGWRRADLD